ncbi:MAG: ParB/RepB/Spo0J family partition protein [Porphyromonas sp.]|nr:ParB/RepB/Spo0J family partition protein [Porphyromonas sp.]
MSKSKRGSLGRGLDALINTDLIDVETKGSSSINEIAIDHITPNEDQPRQDFDEEALRELAASIEHIGIVQPITVYEEEDRPGYYRIISGERRYRASKIAGLEKLPAYVRTVADEQLMEMALIENIQREDLNAIEIALALKKLLEDCELTQDELASRIGKQRSTISNYIRLLRLPAEIQMALKDGKISMGHGRSLLSVEDPELQLAFYEQILEDSLSVRQIEQLVRDYAQQGQAPKKKSRNSKSSSSNKEYDLLSQRFSQLFGTKVRLSCQSSGKGKLTIPFSSEEELENIIALLDRL